MTEPRDTCWNVARDGHSPTCPIAREQARTNREPRPEPPPIPERGEWDAAPMGGWEPRT